MGVVYANGEAMKAANSREKFPVGSILIREKFSSKHQGRPESLAVMIKREPGFNPTSGDWLFVTTNSAMSKVKSKEKSGSCLTCHQMQWQTDFVYPLERATVGTK